MKLLLLRPLSAGKLLTTGGTMWVCVVACAFVFGWRDAAGFVRRIIVHEMLGALR